jgi:hypothetical protein
MDRAERAGRLKFLIRDRDSKPTAMSGYVLAGGGARIIKTPVRSARGEFPSRSGMPERYAGSALTIC